jgi:hypothetical protein
MFLCSIKYFFDNVQSTFGSYDMGINNTVVSEIIFNFFSPSQGRRARNGGGDGA